MLLADNLTVGNVNILCRSSSKSGLIISKEQKKLHPPRCPNFNLYGVGVRWRYHNLLKLIKLLKF